MRPPFLAALDRLFPWPLAAAVAVMLSSVGAEATPTISNVATIGDTAPRLTNVSTRAQALSGEQQLIAGFIVGGSSPKTVVVRVRGPSLAQSGVANPLPNPVLQLVRSSDQALMGYNDDWQQLPATANAALQGLGLAPSDPHEAALLVTLLPGAYTVIASSIDGVAGVGIVEVFEVDTPDSPLLNVSTRGQVGTGDNVMIGGFVVTGLTPQTVVVRARGPSLVDSGVASRLWDPVLTLVRTSDHAIVATNDNWRDAPNASAIVSSGFAPGDDLESAILVTLEPGAYTAIVSGNIRAVGDVLIPPVGVGIVEVFTLP